MDRYEPLRRRTIALVGLMGVGKSSVGRRLANALSLPFRDADAEVEAAAGRSIPEIFAELGEPAFRDGERRVIARLVTEGPGIIATGGGAFVQDETRALILERGIAVWLDSDLDTLVERVRRKDNRPLLREGDPADILARLKQEREPFYAQAPIRVASAAGPHSNTVLRIVQALAAWI